MTEGESKVSLTNVRHMLSCLGLTAKDLALSEYWTCKQNCMQKHGECEKHRELVSIGLMNVKSNRLECRNNGKRHLISLLYTYKVTKKGLEFLSALYGVQITDGE